MAKRPEMADRLRPGEDGATSLEYALLLGFLAMTCVLAITSLGTSLKVPFQNAVNGLS